MTERSDRRCAVVVCDRSARGLQPYCASHHAYWLKTGKEPTHRLNSLRPITTYGGVHNRLEKTRGKASAHRCVACGNQAADWAYNNAGSDERVSKWGRYSLNLDDYSPMCRSCHIKLDTALITECPQGHAYEGRNLIIKQGKRACRTCANAKRNAARRRRRELGLPR